MVLAVDFMGLHLKNPLIVAAGPWSGSSRHIKEAFKAGAGAVVTETIVSEPCFDVNPRLAYDGAGLQNIRRYSNKSFEDWLRELEQIKNENGVVIASILSQSPSEIGYLAEKVEKAGADALELGLSCPMGEGVEVIAANPNRVYSLTKAVVEKVKIPVMVKLSQNMTNIGQVGRFVQEAGGSGISAIDTVRCILGVDLQKRKPFLPTYGGYSGPPIKPMGLAAAASLAQSTSLPVCGVGGISSCEDVLEYLMLGATTVQIGTSLALHGMKHMTKISEDLERWMEKNRIENLNEITGIALKELRSFDNIKVEPKMVSVDGPCHRAECSACTDCCGIYEAISKTEEQINVDPVKCKGCGLCCYVCPDHKFSLVRR